MPNLSPGAPIDLGALFAEPLRRFLAPVEPAIQKLLLVDRLQEIVQSAGRESRGRNIFERLLALLDVTCRIDAQDLERIPATGPAVVTANHPFGFLEAALLAAVLQRIRPDFKIVANALLAAATELREGFIFVNPYGGKESVRQNGKPVRECLQWLRSGGMLVLFPAGDVARLNWKDRGIVDPPWNGGVARLIRAAHCPAVPVYFKGSNGLGFQLIGALHPRLRTANLPREMLNKRGKVVEMRVGRPVAANSLETFDGDKEAIEYLRFRTYLLASRHEREPVRAASSSVTKPVAPETPGELLADEVGRLAPVCANEEFEVYLAAADLIPNALREIGRLRELTFRRAGEGTGKPLDLDGFDPHYLHLFLWSRKAREIAGAYRLGPTAELLPRFGVRGLYSNTLFSFAPELFELTGPALELGRSFIRADYQKHYAPLLLLWKGITQYVAAHPECAVLFGAVSISNEYAAASRNLLVNFLETQKHASLAHLVKPRRPYRRSHGPAWRPRALEELAEPIADLERDGKGVPILIKQCMRAGGRVLGFNIDPHFSNVVDALMMADLRGAPLALLERYMGRERAGIFLERSRVIPSP